MNPFTPWSALAGGALIGLSASLVLLGLGRVAGVSGMVSGALQRQPAEAGWRLSFIAGLLLAGAAAMALDPALLGPSARSWPELVAAGMLVGLGTRMGNGCTSGHGVCGLSRGSPRSVVAVVAFMSAGVISATLTGVLRGAP